jgi:hypothetical protein
MEIGMNVQINPDGTIALPTEAMAHLQARPGQSLRLNLLPGGRIELIPPSAPASAQAPGMRILRGMLDRHDT